MYGLREAQVLYLAALRNSLARLYNTPDRIRIVAHDARLRMERQNLQGAPLEVWDGILRDATPAELLHLVQRVLEDYPSDAGLREGYALLYSLFPYRDGDNYERCDEGFDGDSEDDADDE